jgi:hypothetical protein
MLPPLATTSLLELVVFVTVGLSAIQSLWDMLSNEDVLAKLMKYVSLARAIVIEVALAVVLAGLILVVDYFAWRDLMSEVSVGPITLRIASYSTTVLYGLFAILVAVIAVAQVRMVRSLRDGAAKR